VSSAGKARSTYAYTYTYNQGGIRYTRRIRHAICSIGNSEKKYPYQKSTLERCSSRIGLRALCDLCGERSGLAN
jgi:hypothetical protein